jgi:hypothetical protein
MKKEKSLLFSFVAVSLFIICSCSDTSKKDYYGTWSRPLTADQSMSPVIVDDSEFIADEYLIFNKDMSFETKESSRTKKGADAYHQKGTWEYDSKKEIITVTLDGRKVELEVWQITENKLQVSSNGEMREFERVE